MLYNKRGAKRLREITRKRIIVKRNEEGNVSLIIYQPGKREMRMRSDRPTVYKRYLKEENDSRLDSPLSRMISYYSRLGNRNF